MTVTAVTPAGIAWCAKFPTSTSLDDLAPAWRPKAKAFLAALEAGGAVCQVNATMRPAARAYLMHFACMIAQGGQDPAKVPARAGVAIDWTCGGNVVAAKSAAKAMVQGYGIVFPPALASRHTQGLAVDVNITLPVRPASVPKYIGGDGKKWILAFGDNPALYKFGASFGVIKLVTDAPHWSSDGH